LRYRYTTSEDQYPDSGFYYIKPESAGMNGRVSQLLALRPGEAGLVLLLAILLMGNSAALAVSNVVSVSGFLSEVGVNQILIVWIVDMLLVMLSTGLQSLIIDRYERVSLLRWMSFLFALLYVVLRMFFVFGVPGWINYSILFLLTEQQWLFFPLIFWTLANDLFDMAQAKRLFPLIASGNFVGQILGLGVAAAAPELLSRVDVSSAELLSMSVLIYLLLYLLISEGLRNVNLRRRSRQHESLRETLTEGWGFVKDVPSFRYLMLGMLVVNVAFTVVEFHFLSVTSSSEFFGSAGSFQTFYSLYNLGATLAAIAFQVLLTGRLIGRFGLRNTFLIFPLILLGGISWIVLFPVSVISVVGGLGLPRLSKSTIDESARKSFQALVPEERRGRVSMFMDSYLFAAGAIVGSLILGAVLLIGDQLDLSRVYFVYLAIAALAALVALWFIVRMRAVYDASLLNWRLKRRHRAVNVLEKLEF
jgi:AAA family ATP:ADP antiporter